MKRNWKSVINKVSGIAIMILVHFIIMFIWTFVAQPITVKVTQWAKKGEPITA